MIQFFIQKGLPYKHKILFAKGTPIWATKVNCTGSEYKLSQCPNFTLGHVDDCIERYDAGVVCYSTVGKQTAVTWILFWSIVVRVRFELIELYL